MKKVSNKACTWPYYLQAENKQNKAKAIIIA